ncbi:MAG: hypothetical protein NZM44_05135, partial [Candidatus Calescibacterium sp.]|nr:hypothetical protein [Candidatus Calescibacterium sp.]
MNILSFGGGVQSTTIMLMSIHNELPINIDCAIFADTKNEPQSVYKHIEYISSCAFDNGIEFYIVSGGDILKDIYSNDNKKFVKIPLYTKDEKGKIVQIRRQCTNEYKIRPIR